MITVTLCNDAAIKNIPKKAQFQTWVNQVTSAMREKIPANCNALNINIVDKTESADLNKNFRQKEGPTNILSFTYPVVPGVQQTLLGDLVICAEIVMSEAIAQQISEEAHWAHLTVHGMLHLLGYDHVNPDDAAVMEPIEINILAKLGFKNPYE